MTGNTPNRENNSHKYDNLYVCRCSCRGPPALRVVQCTSYVSKITSNASYYSAFAFNKLQSTNITTCSHLICDSGSRILEKKCQGRTRVNALSNVWIFQSRKLSQHLLHNNCRMNIAYTPEYVQLWIIGRIYKQASVSSRLFILLKHSPHSFYPVTVSNFLRLKVSSCFLL
jgi:hypothetical protein